METDKWYIRGKKGCGKQIRQEFINRGAVTEMNETYLLIFECEDGLFFLEENCLLGENIHSQLGQRIIENWTEIKIKGTKQKVTFKPFDKVLVSNGDDGCYWLATFFSRFVEEDLTDKRFKIINGCRYHFCIPYEGNEHLNGKEFSPEHIERYEYE